MKTNNVPRKYGKGILVFLLFLVGLSAYSQVVPGVYLHEIVQKGTKTVHQLKLGQDYLIYTVYEEHPAKFFKSIGGFYHMDQDTIRVDLEFNSNYEIDSLKTWAAPLRTENKNLVLTLDSNKVFKKEPHLMQPLDATWLFATRGPDTGQERRGAENSRKTLKFLKDGTFQWIAYDTDSMKFSGSGGGSYTSLNGVYTEHIAFFSRDNARVGASLEFRYEVKGEDWHHTGSNSKGEPLYEIWTKRSE